MGLFLGVITAGPNYWNTNASSVVQNITVLTNPQLVSWKQAWGPFSIPAFNTGYMASLGNAMLLNFPIFGDTGSPWQIARLIMLAPITATIVFGFIVSVIYIFSRVLA